MDTRSFDFVILGGGPAACSLALYAHKSNLRCLIIEKDSILGGLGRSWQWSNFIVDTGPHIFHSPDSEIASDWCFYFDDLLVEGDYFSANYLRQYDLYVDYPLSSDNLSEVASHRPELSRSLTLSPSSPYALASASSFKDYVEALVGSNLASLFFKNYPEKLWGISTSEMLADWAPNRIRVTKDRETFFQGQYCAVARRGTGSIFERIESICTHNDSCVFLKSHEITGLITDDNIITKIICDNISIDVCESTHVISTLPITLLSSFLNLDCNLSFRGVLSTYFAMPGRRKILPRDYSWLYFQDDFYSFNRVTEPTSMSKELIIDPCNEFSSYIISETTFQVDKDFDYNTQIPVLKSSSLESILQLPFIDPSCSYHVDYNIEPFVYPIQDTNYRISVKDTSRRVSFIRNLSCLGASSEFHYSDFQVIFRKSKDFIANWTDNKSTSRYIFDGLVRNSSSSLDESDSICSEKVNIIAEIGINHNGDLSLLDQLIDSAASNGADIIKLQYYKTNARIGDDVLELKYNEKAQDTEINVQDILRLSELGLDVLVSAFHKITSLDLIPMASGFSLSDFRDLINIGYKHLKVASMDLNNIFVHKFLATLDSSYTIYISTGMSELNEVVSIIDLYKNSKCRVVLFQCTSSYPLPSSEVNLSVLNEYRRLLGDQVLLGFSDHTLGLNAALASIHYGVRYIEKHFTLNRFMRGPDHFSLEPDELMQLSILVREHTRFIGSPVKHLQPSEYQAWSAQKKSLHLKPGIDLNTKSLDDYNLISPPSGISPIDFIDQISPPGSP